MTRPLVYVAGPYTAPTSEAIRANVLHAQTAGALLLAAGADVFVPHAMSLLVERACPEREWIDAGLRHLARCDAIYVLRGWEGSGGTLGEIALATQLGLPLHYESAALPDYQRLTWETMEWIRQWRGRRSPVWTGDPEHRRDQA